MNEKMINLLLIFMIQIYFYGLDKAFPLHCPSYSHWNIRAKHVCNLSDRYHCLYDANTRLNVEVCGDKPQLDAPGYKIQIVGSFEGVKCENDRYQPFMFWTNGSSFCKYEKSFCNGEGQELFSSGTNKADSTCRCDYTHGYDFLVRPKNRCHCIPSEEDCLCFIRQCPSGFVLSPDYKCAPVSDLLTSSLCPLTTISVENTITPILAKDVQGDNHDYSNVKVRKRSHIPRTFLPILVFLFTGICIVFFHFLDKFTCEIGSRKDNLDKFVPTGAAHNIFGTVTKNPCVLITSSFGSGKTAIALYIACKLKKQGFTTICVSSIDEIVKRYNRKQKQFFLLDDLLGRHCCKISDVTDHDERNWFKINAILNENNSIKILITCRTYIFEMNVEYFATFRNSLSLIHQDLNSEDLQLDVNERRNIYESYFESDLPKSISDNILSLYHFYPLICSSYDKDNALKSLRHPNKIVSAEVSGMRTKEDIGYHVLAILVVLNNTVEKKMFSDTGPNEIVQDIFKESRFTEYPTNKLLLKSFTSLQGEFTICNGSFFSFLTTELFECVASCIGESFIHCILKHSSSKFIKEKLQLYSSPGFDCPYSIKVPREMEDSFYDRLSLDMKGFHFADALSNKLFQSPANRKTFVSYFAKQVDSKLCVDATTGSTVFHIVSALGYSDLLEHFLRFYQYPNINNRNGKGETPLHLACQNGNLQTVQHLIKNKAVVDKMNTKNRTALHYACESGDESIVIYLISNKASTNKKDKDGITPLHIACDRGYYEIVKRLVGNKADTNEHGVNGRTPLHYACEKNFRNIVKYLISKKANVNKTDVQGSTPLHIACINGKEEIVKLLLNKTALTDVKNKQGQTPVNIAFQNGFEKITNLLAANKTN